MLSRASVSGGLIGLALGLALVAPALAEPPAGDKSAAAQSSPQTPPPAPEPKEEMAPKALPVPLDLPVIEKKELEGGLIIEDLKIGSGLEVRPGASVFAHYHGMLKSDLTKVFDSSYQRGEPAAFPLSGVIQGWQKGVPGMKIGGIRRLTIPAAMGYGERGSGDKIPPNSDLVFIVEVVDAVAYEDITEGTGELVGSRAIVVAAFTMKDAEGKEVDSATKENPFIWVPGENNGITSGIEGMKVGGKRKIRIPAQFNFTPPNAPNPKNRPNNVAVDVEIEVLQVKNLVPPTPPASAAPKK